MVVGVGAPAPLQDQNSRINVAPIDAAVSVSREARDLPILKEATIGKQVNEWNTNQLGLRLTADATAAISAAALIAPIITVIDKAIIENASGKRPLFTSMKASLGALLFRPHRFLTAKSFLLILTLYGGTYLSANALDTVTSTMRNQPANKTYSGPAKFAATSTANLSLCLYKDSQFTRMFGTVSARPVPGPSYALFAIRDCMTIFASFNLPPLLAPRISLSESAQRYVSSASVAQFLAPASIQLLSTPLHLLGLDMYNRNGGTTFTDRMAKVRQDWLKSSFARMARIIPAFGVGGVVNTGVRSKMMSRLG